MDWEHHSGTVLEPPVPVDAIVETLLGLTLSIRDLVSEYWMDDVFGAIWMEPGEVAVDRLLDPTVFPEKEGRFHFTVAHEAGHWELHRHIYFRSRRRPVVMCRTSGARLPKEWQADFFAACLLMPRYLVRDAWKRVRWSTAAMRAEDVRREMEWQGLIARRRMGRSREEENIIFERFCQPLAGEFRVSAMAMRIRLEELGYLLRGAA